MLETTNTLENIREELLSIDLSLNSVVAHIEKLDSRIASLEAKSCSIS